MAAIAILASLIPDAYAQSPTNQSDTGHHEKSTDQIFTDAVAAFEADDHQRALDLLDLAVFKDPQPRFVYQRILVLEAMDKPGQALDALAAHRKELAGQPGVGDLTALEQRLREANVATDDALTGRAR
jgi:Tfp pilus assembly protein PilF